METLPWVTVAIFIVFEDYFEEIAAAGLKDIWENAAVPAPVVLANRLDLTLVMLPLLIWG